ncbi:MAG TPA: DinB family protein [Firmicutes bacterium]|nr:DinB family protein [Bacillales bacterium]HJA41309.1 DinB family protein [Bacillota bacterium]
MRKTFELTSSMFLAVVNDLENLTDDQLTKIPEGFNNNILWHVGHVLVSNEFFMFGYPQTDTGLPQSYVSWFNTQTSPADWGEDKLPTISELYKALQTQLEKICNIDDTFLEQKLPFEFPVPGIVTYHDLYALMIYHEADHLGQIKAMKKMVTQ